MLNKQLLSKVLILERMCILISTLFLLHHKCIFIRLCVCMYYYNHHIMVNGAHTKSTKQTTFDDDHEDDDDSNNSYSPDLMSIFIVMPHEVIPL